MSLPSRNDQKSMRRIFNRRNLPTFVLILLFMIGLGLMLYPTVSDYWNSLHQSRAISSYQQGVTELDEEKMQNMKNAAQEYNRMLASNPENLDEENYFSLLDVAGIGTMGWIEIPKIDCQLPIYHGTSDEVLQVGVGHIIESSLPIGGSDTHSVLSGHRGLPSARLFTHLNELKKGDVFMIHVLDEVLTYQVDQIRVVLPDDTMELRIQSGRDLCTLVTCTPYGINTHRLLVRGHRIQNSEEAVSVAFDAVQIRPYIISVVLIVPLIVILFAILFYWTRKRPEYFLKNRLKKQNRFKKRRG